MLQGLVLKLALIRAYLWLFYFCLQEGQINNILHQGSSIKGA